MRISRKKNNYMENIRFDIVKNMPIPQKVRKGGSGRSSVYPFAEMEMGDCLKFEASSPKDMSYRRMYTSARSHTRRKECTYDFRFAQIDEKHFGCWKVERTQAEPDRKRVRHRRKASEINSIPPTAIMEAWETAGSVAGAAKKVGLSPRTFMRLIEKIGTVSGKQ